MAEELTMPRLSDTMEEGTIARWLKQAGDAFKEGDVLAEIETDKATMEFQAYADGTLLRILVGDGESVGLGEPIAVVGAPGESADEDQGGEREAAEQDEGEQGDAEQGEAEDDGGAQAQEDAEVEAEGERAEGEARERPSAEEQPKEEPRGSGEAEEARAADGGERAQREGGRSALRVSPIARRIADEAGLDLAQLAGRGSGPDGRVVKADVERLLERGRRDGEPRREAEQAERRPSVPAPQPGVLPVEEEAELRDPTPMLRAVARRMAEASSTVPHFYVATEIDMGRALALRSELNEALAESGEKVSVNDLVVRACAVSLLQHPQAHRSWVEGKLAYHSHAHVGIAVALDDGLIVPVLRQAEAKGLRQIAAETRDLVGRAREGKLRQREIEGGTFTVSNLGMFDVSSFLAIINPPESAILAVGAVVERPVVRDGAIVARPIMSVTLSCDHRACSGADGSRLLGTIKRHLEAPALLLA